MVLCEINIVQAQIKVGLLLTAMLVLGQTTPSNLSAMFFTRSILLPSFVSTPQRVTPPISRTPGSREC